MLSAAVIRLQYEGRDAADQEEELYPGTVAEGNGSSEGQWM